MPCMLLPILLCGPLAPFFFCPFLGISPFLLPVTRVTSEVLFGKVVNAKVYNTLLKGFQELTVADLCQLGITPFCFILSTCSSSALGLLTDAWGLALQTSQQRSGSRAP